MMNNRTYRNGAGELMYLPIESIEPHPDNPRKNLGDLTELTESIREQGILQNITVVLVDDGVQDEAGASIVHYRALIGHRRLAAAKLAGLTEVPCVVAEMDYKDQLGVMFTENVQRADLTAYEQAECLQMMIDLGASQTDVAKQTGLSEATVSRRLRLLKLDKKRFDNAQERGGASMDVYIKIAEIKSAADRKELLDAVGTDNFNGRYQRAVRDQAIKEKTPKIIKEVSDFAKAAPKNLSPWSNGWRQEKQCQIAEWKPGDLLIKKPVKNAEYVYLFQWNTAYILRKEEKAATTHTVSEEEKAARKRRKQLKDIAMEMYQLRRDFMVNFTAGLQHKDDLLEWALANAVGCYAGHMYRADFNKKVLQEMIGQDPQRTYDIDKDLLKIYYDKNPSAAMALITYCNSGDGLLMGYYREGWGKEMPSHTENVHLDVIYQYLCRLGYRMSDEEKQLQDGTHPLFKKEDA